MSVDRCIEPVSLDDLIAYHLGELSEEREQAIEEHYIGCRTCSERLEFVVELGAGIEKVVQQGLVSTSATSRLVEQAEARGIRIRSYRVDAGGQVACTAAPTDDFVVIRLGLDVRGAESVDVDVRWTALDTGTTEERLVEDVAYDHDTNEIVMLFSGGQIREFPRSRWTMEAVAHEPGGQRRFGPYTLDHTPWEQLKAPH